MNILRGVIALTLLVLFITYVFWAWSNPPKRMFDAMSRLPLEEDDTTGESRQP